jgi:hypothetical protein
LQYDGAARVVDTTMGSLGFDRASGLFAAFARGDYWPAPVRAPCPQAEAALRYLKEDVLAGFNFATEREKAGAWRCC